MKVLVTGGAGLIGMTLRALLSTQGHGVVAVDHSTHGRDDPDLLPLELADIDGLHRLMAEQDVTAVAHCGAISGPMLARGRPLEIVGTNITGTANVLEAARLAGVARVAFCSSISVYGDARDVTLTEDLPPHPTSVYGASKTAGEQLVEAYAAEYGQDGVSLRIGRVYGPYRRGNCIIKAMIEDAAAGRETVIPCAPDFLYHYVWVGDVAAALIMALTAGTLPSRVYNVGSGEAQTMQQIVNVARPLIPGLRVRLTPGADDVPDVQTRFDISRIAAELGFLPAYPLARGIAAYAAALA